ncbi:transport protein particle subunit trs23 [Aspergillus lentulus]|uniref:Trafficking protein particle complex subunit n=1 Tax=Aspergillus lentulus TaxID=293939 RepID=A0AAN4PKX3_ASPLE|nr:transport protein particle subunit trs23 [Aspergillus lentulus]
MEEARPSVEGLALALHEHIFTQPQEKFANQPWKLVKAIGIFAQNQAEDKAVFSLIIINKAGGLIYQREFQPGLRKLSTNDYLVLAGTFHGVHAITRSITPKIPISAPLPTTPASSSNVALSSPSGTSTPTPAASAYSLPNPGVPVTGLESLETDKFRLTCFQTLTGTKFLLFTDPLMANIDAVMKKIYELYSDYVMKNPFYQLEMPVRPQLSAGEWTTRATWRSGQ